MARLRRNWAVVGVTVVGSAWVLATWAWQSLLHAGPEQPLARYVSDVAGLIVVIAVVAAAEWRNARIQERLAERESQLAQLLDDSPDAIVVVRDGRVIFANGAAARLAHAPAPSWFLGRPVLDLIHPEDRARQAANLATLVEGEPGKHAECRIVRADGTVMEADVAGAAVRYERGPAIQVVTRDVSERRAAERSRDAAAGRLRHLLDSVGLVAMTVDREGIITFANRATHELVRAEPGSLVGTSALERLWLPDHDAARDQLRAAIEDGSMQPMTELDFVLPDGLRRTVRWHLAILADEDGTNSGIAAIGEDITDARATTDRLGVLLATAPVGICAVDTIGRVRYAEGGPFARPEPWEALDDLPAALAGLVTRAIDGGSGEALIDLEGRLYEASVRHVDGPEPGAIAILVEVTERARLERDRHRLATAIDQATDAVVITDREGRISYVNPAFERVTGYTIAEAIGNTPRILKSGVQGDGFYAAMWKTLLDGRPWSGELVNRAKDGSLFREEATIAPVRDESGVVVNFVAVKRDVTRLRSLENALEAEVRERAAIVTALERIDRSGPLTDIASAICYEMRRLPGVDAVIVDLVDGGDIVPFAITGPRGMPMETERPLPASRAAYLLDRAARGAWAEAWEARDIDGPYGERMAEAGIAGAAYVPLRTNGNLLGILVLATTNRSEVEGLVERLPSLVSLGTVATSLLADGVRARHAAAGVRREIEEIAEGRLFHIVYQPVIDLRTGEALGFEALTRFDNAERPDAMFLRASAAGLGTLLESVTIEAAIAGATTLPLGAFLSLNASPELLTGSDALTRLLHGVVRPIVLEVTEHAEIEDYAALREAARRLPVPVRLAVDDAGAGFASLRHVLELAPDIVKIDRSIVMGIDTDPTRQALIAGLRFFASRRGIQLIAEGIETPSELAALSALSVPLGQGYLLGMPATAAEVVRSVTMLGAFGVPEAVSQPHGNGNGSSNGNGSGNGHGNGATSARRPTGAAPLGRPRQRRRDVDHGGDEDPAHNPRRT